jgi:uncharacterized protein
VIAEIDVRDLLGAPGSSREVAVSGELEGLGTEVATLAAGSPVKGELLLESVVEGILVSGRLSAVVACRCARCLREFEQPLALDVSELFVLEPDPDGDEYPMDPGGSLAPEQMLRDAVGLELPFSPLCRPDCLGLCERCGGDRNLGECSCEPEPDHRWAPLERLLQDLN